MAVKFSIKFKGEDLGVFNSDEVTMDQALTLENETGLSLAEMVNTANRGSAKGIQAVVWFRFFQLGRPQPLHTNFTFGDYAVDPIDEDAEEADAGGPTDAADPVAVLEEAFKKPATSGSAR